jgi:two-component SAPR family response regulator
MNKKLIRLTESDLHNIVKESVNRVLKESSYDYMNKEYYRLKKLYLEFGKIYKESDYINDDNINGAEDIHNAYLNLDEAFVNLFRILREYGKDDKGDAYVGQEAAYGA